MSISKTEFEAALQGAISRREAVYKNSYSLHIRWEDDDTLAERDENSFRSIIEALGFPDKPEIHIIQKANKTPAWELLPTIAAIMAKAESSDGRSIVIIHYAGHGNADANGELVLMSSSGKRIQARSILDFTAEQSAWLTVGAKVDVIMIFDCCYNFLATRTTNPASRIVEILTAGDERDPIAFQAGTRASFTSKLAIEIRNRQQLGHKFVEFADVMADLRRTSPVKKPSYVAKLGTGSITLPLVNTAGTAQHHGVGSIQPPGLLATFSIHVSHTFINSQLRTLVAWLQSLDKDHGLTLEGVKETISMVFIFESSYLCFLRIQGLAGVTLICENKPSDFSWLLRPASNSSGPKHIEGFENVPPSARRTLGPKK
jgi:hypothetical protein